LAYLSQWERLAHPTGASSSNQNMKNEGDVLADPNPMAPVLGGSRSRVLGVLREAGEPVGVQDVATQTGLHVNTARFHLDALVEAGLIERQIEERTQPGRPRVVFTAAPASDPPLQPNYRLLAEMLTGLIASILPQPEQTAVEAGEGWGRYLAPRPAPLQRIDASEGIRRLSAVLDDAGFAPAQMSDLPAPVLGLRHCPFREIAVTQPELVCSLHLGLIRGVLSEVRAPLTAERLEPFVEPSLCLAHLTPA
jgi:predicted ArsR family transcriptional regulator